MTILYEPLAQSPAEQQRILLKNAQFWGFGLRPQHATELMQWSQLPRIEVLVDNYIFQNGGPNLEQLAAFRGRSEMLLHGVGLNLGGLDPLDQSYLREVKKICQTTQSKVYSDHLAFSQLNGHHIFDLLPIPLVSSQLHRLVDRVQEVQDVLGFRLGIENPSAYLAYPEAQMPELEFLQGLADATGCGLLLDVNNLYVNAHNFDFDATAALGALDAASIMQYHISGHTQRVMLLHDTHDRRVIEDVWQLLDLALVKFGPHPVILERDDDEVSLDEILDELCRGIGRGFRRNTAASVLCAVDSAPGL